MNYVRMSTLLEKECRRFLRVYNQTIVSPVINAVILFIIFTFAFNRSNGIEEYKLIVAIGVIMMTSLQASYYNTQSTITVAKVLGFIKDYTIAPLTTWEIMVALTISSCLRALMVGVLTFVSLMFFLDITVAHPVIALYYFIIGITIFAMLGIVIGFASHDFDKAQAYSSYIVVPLTMLSGTFYSINALPTVWQNIVLLNPVFYIIEGFRNGIMGGNSVNTWGIIITAITTPVLLYFSNYFLKKNLQKIDY